MISKVLVSPVTGKFYGVLRFKFLNHLFGIIQRLNVAERFGNFHGQRRFFFRWDSKDGS